MKKGKRNLFRIEREDYFYRLCLFGMRFKFRSKKLMSRKILRLEQRLGAAEYNARSASRWNAFLWSNEDEFTARDYEWYAASQFYRANGYYPNLKDPKTVAEKITWLKLHWRHPDYARICDKLWILENVGRNIFLTLPVLLQDLFPREREKLVSRDGINYQRYRTITLFRLSRTECTAIYWITAGKAAA